jgi:cobalamin synthase
MTDSNEKCGALGLSCETRKYPVVGFLFGMMFPIIAWIIDFIFKDINFTLSGIWQMHLENPL